ncbi:MAG: ATP-dependent helicase HrpB [Alcanivorax sp.]|jgi:ATP-dependent helicase HrpB|uniref:ATP-dependent helicase HrpB n=1 Tax=Alcanivorax TaxID=59753 RepID=UPI000C542ED8|nr:MULTISPECIES: ATP-dependent helicase HrpB [Alcanivorax]MAC14491.1 ATP-dependent helicase HrpB [Alcanivorax sp.]MBG32005.1 ATP-dependent helicase HrpB [Alcanivorax sp.]|tara:strand:+ start:57280 stop:59733 length:2454 start_codon:yes stop_codon:yes gene_type:complete
MHKKFPVDDVVVPLRDALLSAGCAILEAPPGAGKSTRVPLRLLDHFGADQGRILMLEPRRVAARSVATFMASQLGEPVGQTVGYRTRTDTRVSAATRLEVVTEGVLTRMALSDPELQGISLVIFDEFHERSLNADLGLALVSEIREAFRPDLGLLVMSATLDCGPLVTLLNAPVIRSEGRSFPVDVMYRPPAPRQDWRDHCVQKICSVAGDAQVVLVFLPGRADIRRVARGLSESGLSLPIAELHGGLPLAQQQQVLDSARNGDALIVLTTNVAETSLTIEGVTHVIDSGLAREPVYDPARHRSRLVTRRISEASARQRSGRAGRLGPGCCVRLWPESEVMASHQKPEIARVALDQLVLDLARWGCREPQQMHWLEAPPLPAWQSAVARLRDGGALDRQGGLTDHGAAIASLGVEPALAMLILAGREQGLPVAAARVAALLSERDILNGQGVDLRSRLQALESHPDRHRLLLAEAQRLLPGRPPRDSNDWRDCLGGLLARVYPRQVARLRQGQGNRYQMMDGPGVQLPPGDSLAGTQWLLILDTDGQPRDVRIRLAMPLEESDLQSVMAQHGQWHEQIGWDSERQRVTGWRQHRLGAIVLQNQPMESLSAEQQIQGLLEGLRGDGLRLLPWSESCRQWQARVTKLAAVDESAWPDVSDAALLENLERWLAPFLAGMRTLQDLKRVAVHDALNLLLTEDQHKHLQRCMPEAIVIPTGRRVQLDYKGDTVVLAVKLQELFGLTQLPLIAEGKLTISAHLLTPAGRPAAITDNLERFWRENYQAVRKDLRGRYPKHPWPEDPLTALATAATKKRMSSDST